MVRNCRVCGTKLTTDDDLDHGICGPCMVTLAEDDEELGALAYSEDDDEIDRMAEYHHRNMRGGGD